MIEFPTSPAPQQGQIYTVAGKSWKWNGTSWEALSAFGGSWDLISGKPTFHAVALSGDYDDLADKPDLKPVATSGLYSDLTGTPTLGTAAATASTDYATAAQGALAATASQPGHTHTVLEVTDLYDNVIKKAPLDVTPVNVIRVVTQAEYNALTKDSNTIYFIK